MKTQTARLSLLVLICLLAFGVGASFFVEPYDWIHFSRSDAPVDELAWNLSQLPERKPLAEYSRAMARAKLFRYSVREEPPRKQRSIVEDLEFLGTSNTPSGARAYLRNVITSETRAFSIGETIGDDFRVTEIGTGGVVLVKGNETFELKR